RGEHEAPGCGDDRAEPRRRQRVRLSLDAALDARDHVHGHLVDVLREVDDGVADARHRPLARPAPLEVRVGHLPPQLAESGPLLRVGDDDEVPVLRVRGGRRLLRQPEALLQHLPLDRTRQVEALADGPGRREELVWGQLEARAAIIAESALSYREGRWPSG